MKREMVTHELCPHCGNKRLLPSDISWNARIQLLCQECGKKYWFFRGKTAK
jgi:predicted RNA-binding Zn-ribbon protein involved in translation (DUF1610 family)